MHDVRAGLRGGFAGDGGKEVVGEVLVVVVGEDVAHVHWVVGAGARGVVDEGEEGCKWWSGGHSFLCFLSLLRGL